MGFELAEWKLTEWRGGGLEKSWNGYADIGAIDCPAEKEQVEESRRGWKGGSYLELRTGK